MNRRRVVEDIAREEGFVPHAYQDHRGFWTIGHGILIDPRGGGITEEESRYLLDNRLDFKIEGLERNIPWWRELPEGVQEALCNMAYQMGVGGVLGFKKMLSALRGRDFEGAASEALNSAWADQTPSRAKRVAEQIRNA